MIHLLFYHGGDLPYLVIKNQSELIEFHNKFGSNKFRTNVFREIMRGFASLDGPVRVHLCNYKSFPHVMMAVPEISYAIITMRLNSCEFIQVRDSLIFNRVQILEHKQLT